VEPLEALETIVGVFLYSWMNPRELPSDARLTYQLAQSVLRLRQLVVVRSHFDPETGKVENDYRVPPGLAVAFLGKRIRTQLAPFLANVTALVEAEDQKQQERVRALYTPLVPAASA
jgi:hypothetical protein